MAIYDPSFIDGWKLCCQNEGLEDEEAVKQMRVLCNLIETGAALPPEENTKGKSCNTGAHHG